MSVFQGEEKRQFVEMMTKDPAAAKVLVDFFVRRFTAIESNDVEEVQKILQEERDIVTSLVQK